MLKPGGKVIILEFSMPEKFPVKQLYRFYFKRFLPFIGKIVSRDKSAYTYLPQSVESFPKPLDFQQILTDKGLKQESLKSLSFGIATLYTAFKEQT